METTIRLNIETKKQLDKLKIHNRESYNELIQRMIQSGSLKEMDKESLIATIEVLSDPELMKGIKEALEEEQRGEYGMPLEEVKKELGIK